MKCLCYNILLLFFLFGCRTHYFLQKSEASHQNMKKNNSSVSADSIISPYRQQLGSQMQLVIAQSQQAFTKDGNETTLGNMVCDAMYFIYDSLKPSSAEPIVLMNRGGLRAGLPSGNITVGNIFELMPFDNELTLIKLNTNALKQALKLILEKKHGFKNMQLSITQNDTLVKINGQVLDNAKSYYLLTSDYLANGGDGFSCLKNAVEKVNLNLKLRDAIVLYCKRVTREQKKLIPYTDGRLQL